MESDRHVWHDSRGRRITSVKYHGSDDVYHAVTYYSDDPDGGDRGDGGAVPDPAATTDTRPEHAASDVGE
jgi:hypothetical protein